MQEEKINKTPISLIRKENNMNVYRCWERVYFKAKICTGFFKTEECVLKDDKYFKLVVAKNEEEAVEKYKSRHGAWKHEVGQEYKGFQVGGKIVDVDVNVIESNELDFNFIQQYVTIDDFAMLIKEKFGLDFLFSNK